MNDQDGLEPDPDWQTKLPLLDAEVQRIMTYGPNMTMNIGLSLVTTALESRMYQKDEYKRQFAELRRAMYALRARRTEIPKDKGVN